MLLLLLTACGSKPTVDPADCDAPAWYYPDADADGFGDPERGSLLCENLTGLVEDGTDCDDGDAEVNPGAAERCNGGDDDCDGDADEDAPDAAIWYLDQDGDGAGGDTTTSACSPVAGYSLDGGDCDDADPDIEPGAAELCDGVDQDCDGAIDEDAADASTWYPDADEDGWGDDASAVLACESPAGHVTEGGDCDDQDAAYNPGAEESDCSDPTDWNCDGSTGRDDADADGWVACEECDDSDPDTNPEAEEVCGGGDDDCDGSIDEEGAAGAPTWYADADADGYGDAASTTAACTAPAGYVADATDCDDGRDDTNPGALEVCGGLDEDCDGQTDEDDASDAVTWYLDADGDGYGDASSTVTACELPDGWAATGDDCDDADAAYHPGAAEPDCDDPTDWNCDGLTGYADADADGWAACEECDDTDATVSPDASESCNGVDDDCDGESDEDDASDASTWYADADADGYGDATVYTVACSAPSGHVADDTDCDDTASGTNPGATEVCDTADTDEDCDGRADDDDSAPSAATRTTYYVDADRDGYGSTTSGRYCDQPAGYTTNSDDCDDTNASVSPVDTEDCGTTWDDDCDGSTNDVGATACSVWYQDGDSDGYGSASSQCTCSAEGSYTSAVSTDCNDASSSVNPGASESCGTAADDDCDGSTNDVGATSCTTFYEDADLDGYGGTSSQCTCSATGNYSASTSTDCDDASSADYPGATETVNNGDDEDCDGVDSCYQDADNDDYGTTTTIDSADLDCADANESGVATDCDDASSADYPGATETVNNGDDEDCDGVDSCYQDADNDDYGTSVTIDSVDLDCADANEATVSTDCDDALAAVNPGGSETCSTSYDDDCDGVTNELGAASCATYYLDSDADGYGSTTSGCYCSSNGSYTARTSTDCDDGDASVSPAASETCATSYDDDCDGATNEQNATSCTTYYYDADGDAYGDASYSACYCSSYSYWDTTDASDCDDADAGVNPGETEVCDNGVDDDCDGDGGSCEWSGSTALTSADAQYTGQNAGDYTGGSVRGGGDVDADGYDDFLVGATNYPSSTYYGIAYLVTGPSTGSASLGSATALLYGDGASDYAGQSVAIAPDVNRDGYDDIVVGAYYDDYSYTNNGIVYVVRGPETGSGYLSSRFNVRIYGEASSDYLGCSVAGLGDFDSDNYGEILVGAYGNDDGGTSAGKAYVVNASYSASTYQVTSIDVAAFEGENSSDYAGRAVARAGDVDADGYPDALIGAYGVDSGGSSVGAAYLVLSGASGTVDLSSADAKLTGVSSGDYAGFSVDGAGDVDADGYDDFLVGAYQADGGGSGSGAAYLVLGPQTGSSTLASADASFIGENASEYAGYAVAGPGDVDGDGNHDVLVSAPYADGGGSDRGVTYLVYGPVTGSLDLGAADASFTGESNSDYAGLALGSAGDNDADGYDDFLIGAYLNDDGGSSAGAAWLLLGGGM